MKSLMDKTASPSEFHLSAGHSAKFLVEDSPTIPFGAAELRALAAKHTLTDADNKIVSEMVESLERDGVLPFSWSNQEKFFWDTNPPDRLVPYLIFRFKFRVLPKRREVSDFPIHVLIEPASICNLRCVMCFQTDRTFTKKGYMGTMDLGLFRDVVDQAVEGGAGAISLGSRGEPYMTSDFGEMLKYVSDKDSFFDVKINTNATRMGEADCHDLLSSNVNVITISADAHTKELYEEIRVRGKFDRMVENVERLCAIREKHYPDSKAEIRISGVKFREDQDEQGFADFWQARVDNVAYVRMQDRWDTYANPPHPDHTSPCDFLWERLYVWYDGTCNPCDEDYKSRLSPGNLADRSIREIWHGEAMTRLREQHLNDARSKCFPCDRCGV